MIETSIGNISLDDELLHNYFTNLVNHFFKILPIRESEDESLPKYIKSLQIELVGCGEFVTPLRQNSSFLSLLSILQYLIDNPDTSVADVRREVFHAISICNKLKDKYIDRGASE